ncbi:MAG: hypothetical protein ACUVQY_06935 [Thermoproteota archaeon]
MKLETKIHHAKSSLGMGKCAPIPSRFLIPASGSGKHGLRGEYYDNRDLKGEPVLTRIDEEVNFDWEEGRPALSCLQTIFQSAGWESWLCLKTKRMKSVLRLTTVSDFGLTVSF